MVQGRTLLSFPGAYNNVTSHLAITGTTDTAATIVFSTSAYWRPSAGGSQVTPPRWRLPRMEQEYAGPFRKVSRQRFQRAMRAWRLVSEWRARLVTTCTASAVRVGSGEHIDHGGEA